MKSLNTKFLVGLSPTNSNYLKWNLNETESQINPTQIYIRLHSSRPHLGYSATFLSRFCHSVYAFMMKDILFFYSYFPSPSPFFKSPFLQVCYLVLSFLIFLIQLAPVTKCYVNIHKTLLFLLVFIPIKYFYFIYFLSFLTFTLISCFRSFLRFSKTLSVYPSQKSSFLSSNFSSNECPLSIPSLAKL